MRLTRPENLAVTETTRHLTFSAPGFGKLRITVKKTNDTRTLKDTKQYGRSRLERTMTFPGVTVRCQARVPPPQREIAIKICDSVVFTRPLVRKIRVERRPMKLQGLRDAKAFQRAIGAAEQRIEACWRGTVISLKRPPEGTLLLQLGYRADGQRDLIAVHYPTVYDRNPLARRCFNEALASLRFTTNGRLVHLQVRWDLLAY